MTIATLADLEQALRVRDAQVDRCRAPRAGGAELEIRAPDGPGKHYLVTAAAPTLQEAIEAGLRALDAHLRQP